jgi:hypothetical protein
MKLSNLKSIDDMSDIRKRIVKYFSSNKNISVNDIEVLADELNIDVTTLNTEIYLYLTCFTTGGRYIEDNRSSKDFTKDEIRKGIKIESEHVDINNPYARYIQYRITLDHLSEISDYNTRLIAMEKDAE